MRAPVKLSIVLFISYVFVSVQSALSKVSDLLQTHVADTKYTIQNELGLCMVSHDW